MPLQEIRKINEYTLLGRWALTETAAQLQEHPDWPKHLALPGYISSQQRQAEWLASRLLAYQLLGQYTPHPHGLHYDDHGKPVFTEGRYAISLTHTQHEVAVILSERYEVGIDVESIKPKILRVRDRFLSEAERGHISNDLIPLTIAWSAKETLYKIRGKKDIIFAENLFLSPFEVAPTGSMAAKIKTSTFEQDYTVYFQFSGETVLTYCCDETADFCHDL